MNAISVKTPKAIYQYTLTKITKDILTNAILKNDTNTEIKHLYFKGYPQINTISDALDIIENKRKTLLNPDNHNFICMEIVYNGIENLDRLTEVHDTFADNLNAAYNDALFIISFVYLDEQHVIHAILCISDIERSLTESSKNALEPELVDQILTTSLQDFDVTEFFYDSIYLFKGEDKSLAYDGVFHIKAVATLNFTKKTNLTNLVH